MSSPSPVALWIAASRPRTLPAAIAPVLVGSALAYQAGSFSPLVALICLLFALLVQIGTNFANDYYDFVQGADTSERVGPRRAVASGWVAPAVMKRAMTLVFVAAFVVGLTLLRFGGWPLLVIGVASIVCGIAYTGGPFPLGYNGLGDVFVFLFFGLVAVGTTYFVQAGALTPAVWASAVAIGVLAANILVVNNYRDVETDAKAGKRTTVVRFGRGFAQGQFATAHAIAFVIPLLLLHWAPGRWLLLAPCVLLPMAWRHLRRLQSSRSPLELIALLGDTGRYLALYALILSAALIWA